MTIESRLAIPQVWARGRDLQPVGLQIKDRLIVHRAGGAKKVPWIIGRGTTTELMVTPAGSKLGDASAVVRVSAADMVDQIDVFSHLPDYDRLLALVSGRGYTLYRVSQAEWERINEAKSTGQEIGTIDGEAFETLTGQQVLSLDGGEHIATQLTRGKCLDLNIFIKKGFAKTAKLEILESRELAPKLPILTAEKETILLICLKGGGSVHSSGKKRQTLQRLDVVEFQITEGRGILELSHQEGSRFALVRLKNN